MREAIHVTIPCPHLLSISSVKLHFALLLRYVVGTVITTETALPNNALSVCP